MKGIKDGSVVTRRDPVESWEFLTCVLQQAYLPRWLGMKSEKRLDVMGNLERAEDVPPVWILQGDKDSVVSDCFCLGLSEDNVELTLE